MKARRKELGISVEDIAIALGVSVATVYRYENGDIEKVPGSVLEPLSKVLQISPAYLMGWEKESLGLTGESLINHGVYYSSRLAKLAKLKSENSPSEEIQKVEEECKELARVNHQLAQYTVLLQFFDLLNTDGQNVAIERVKELSEIAKYRKEGRV